MKQRNHQVVNINTHRNTEQRMVVLFNCGTAVTPESYCLNGVWNIPIVHTEATDVHPDAGTSQLFL